MLKYSLLLYFIVQATLCKAQLNVISGLITYNTERLSGANIKNTKSHTQSVSNERGEFKLEANTGDTLIINKTDFVIDTLIVAGQEDLIIQLQILPFILKTVVIKSTPASPESIYEQNKKEYKDIYVKGDKSHMIFIPLGPLGLLSAGLALNIDKLYNALSKQGKDARRLQRNLTGDYKNSVVDKRFNPLAAQITGYKDDKLKDFIMDNRPSYEMVARSSDYDLVQYIKQKMEQNGK